jgi:GT2 family glycosyltransferase
VSVVVVSWNRRDDLRRCLGSIRKAGGPDVEVVVVDNGSTDGSREMLEADRGVRLVVVPENIGPAAARNRGIATARGDYILLLDSDAAVTRRAIGAMTARLDEDPGVGVVGGRIVSGYNRRLDQWVYTQEPRTHERSAFDTYSFSAAGAMIRASALREAGPFWGELFIYNEEVELSIRVLRMGYRIVYCPEARILHFPSESGRVPGKGYWYFQIRNWIWICYRHYPAYWRSRTIAVYSTAYLCKSLRAGALRPCLAGIVDGVRRRDLIAEHPEKLDAPEMKRLRGLKRRNLFRSFSSMLAGARAVVR